MSLGERILVYRQQKHLSQESFAHIIGVSFATLNRWESDKQTPRGLQKKRIERILKKQENLTETKAKET